MVHPVYETTDARIIRGSALPWGEATHDENNTIIQMKSCFQNCRGAVLNKASNVIVFKDTRNCQEKVKKVSHLKPNQLAPSIYIMKELCFFSLDQ